MVGTGGRRAALALSGPLGKQIGVAGSGSLCDSATIYSGWLLSVAMRKSLGQASRLAAATGAYVCFEDEAGQNLRLPKARTWAPRSHTPVGAGVWQGLSMAKWRSPLERVP